MKRIAVFGASGFVGATFVERMLERGDHELKIFIHSPGNAWRLARNSQLKLETVDLLSARAVEKALEGCTHVVNCSRGSKAVMHKGLANLLHASTGAGIQRFVHLSSVAVYGDPPPPESVKEDAPAEPEKGSYGWIKLRQDEMVERAARDGLSCVTLCPPNISGAHSVYLLSLVDAMRHGEFVLVDGGSHPCVLVDVVNLAAAMESSLSCDHADGKRLFVTDGEPTTWKQLADALAPLAEPPVPFSSISLAEAQRMFRKVPRRRASPLRTIKHLFSGDVRQAMRKDPLLEKVDTFARGTAAMLGRPFESHFRLWLEGPVRVPKVSETPRYHPALCPQQLRGVRHSCDRAKQVIGYAPPLTFAESMKAFRRWYEEALGLGGPSWDLARELWRAG